jgi:hypothetical protein
MSPSRIEAADDDVYMILGRFYYKHHANAASQCVSAVVHLDFRSPRHVCVPPLHFPREILPRHGTRALGLHLNLTSYFFFSSCKVLHCSQAFRSPRSASPTPRERGDSVMSDRRVVAIAFKLFSYMRLCEEENTWACTHAFGSTSSHAAIFARSLSYCLLFLCFFFFQCCCCYCSGTIGIMHIPMASSS